MFGDKFKAQWQGNADQVGLKDKIGILGLGISQLSAGQSPNIMPAWEAVEARRAKRKMNEAMGNPEFVSGFTPQQQAMLSAMPPEMAQSLIMEKMFAPPPSPVKADWQTFGGDMYNMNDIDPVTGKPRLMLDGMSAEQVDAAKMTADRELRKQDGLMLGYADGSPEMNEYLVTGKPVERPKGPEWRTATPEEAAANGAAAGQINTVTGKFDAQNPPSGVALTTNPDGSITFEQGSGVKAKPFTEGQAKDVVFSTRAKGALEALDPIAGALTDRSDVAAGWLPMGLGGGMQSDEYQVSKTAGDEFLQAILRKDTGAAITAPEQELYGETYLPRPGDNEARLKYKKEARQRAVNAIDAGMSPAQMIAQEKALAKGATIPLVDDDAEYLKSLGLE